MKKVVIEKCMNIIKKYQNYDKEKLEIIEYGLTSLYLTISKLVVIGIIAGILGIFKEMTIFVIIYNIIRMPSFGIHATKSWICLVVSIICFITCPILCINFNISNLLKLILGISGTVMICVNSPADTKKKPIVNPKRRMVYKIISTNLSIIYVSLSIIVQNKFLSNCFIIGMLLQNIMISPITYRIFKQPYNNYKLFLKLHPDFLN